MASDWPCLTAQGEHSLLMVSVVPGAKRTGADGLHDGALRVRLVARPVEGQANQALLAWLADELELPKRALRVHRGETSRRKQVALDVPFDQISTWLDRLLAAP